MTHHPDAWAVLALLLVALALFGPVVMQPGGLVYPPVGEFSDLTITHWPNIEFAITSLRTTGRLPLWRPTIMSGTPFAANPLSGLFYFPHLIFLVAPLAIGFNVLFVAHIWLTGCGAYALLRAWQIERQAAFIGALTWMATPKLFAHLGAGHVGMVEAVAWMPLAVLAAHRLVEQQRAMDGARLGAVWAVQFLADPRISFYSAGLSFSYLVILLFAKTSGRRALASFCLAVSTVAMTFAVLSAALLLPFAEFITQSNRSALTLAEAGEGSLPLRQLVGLLLADWGGFHEWMVYVGILPLILAIRVACCVFRNDATRNTQYTWLIACVLVALLFSLGANGPLFPILFQCLPGLTLLRVPPRAWFVVAFAVAMLCAFGVESMMCEAKKPRRWLTLTSAALAMFALMFGMGGFLLLRDNAQASARAGLLHLAIVAPASLAVVLLRAHGRIGARSLAVVSAIVIVATLLPVDLGLYRVIPEAQAFSDRADVATWLASQSEQFRVYSPSYSVPQHVAQRAGLELADGVDPMQLASYAQLMQAATGTRANGYSVTIPPFPPNSDVHTAWRNAKPDVRLLGKLNVRYIVAEFPVQAKELIERARFGSTFIYENTQALPRAIVGEGTTARITTLTPDRTVVEADGPGILALSQVYYPGWRVTVDGRPVSIQVVDSLMQVNLDAGHHAIEFVFDSRTVQVGILISAAGWSGLLITWLIRLLSRKAILHRSDSGITRTGNST